jgi:hypothetical protein
MLNFLAAFGDFTKAQKCVRLPDGSFCFDAGYLPDHRYSGKKNA